MFLISYEARRAAPPPLSLTHHFLPSRKQNKATSKGCVARFEIGMQNIAQVIQQEKPQKSVNTWRINAVCEATIPAKKIRAAPANSADKATVCPII